MRTAIAAYVVERFAPHRRSAILHTSFAAATYLALCFVLCAGCGGGGSASNQGSTNSNVSGSWQLIVNSSTGGGSFPPPPNPVPFALYLSQSGEAVTGVLLQETNGCMDNTQSLAGSLRTGQLILSTPTSSVSLTAQVGQNGTLNGTFQFNGLTPYCQPNDSGTFTGVAVASLAGQWSGTATSAGHTFPISLSFNEISLARSGFPALKGQATISSGSLGCVTGTATFDGEQQGSRISGQGGGASGPLPALDNTVVIGGALISNTLSSQNIQVTAGLGTALNPAPTSNSMTMFHSASCPIPPLTQDSGTAVLNRSQ